MKAEKDVRTSQIEAVFTVFLTYYYLTIRLKSQNNLMPRRISEGENTIHLHTPMLSQYIPFSFAFNFLYYMTVKHLLPDP